MTGIDLFLAWQTVERAAKALFATVTAVASRVSGWLLPWFEAALAWIRSAMDRIGALLRGLWNLVKPYVEAAGAPAEILVAWHRWDSEVKSAVIASESALGQLDVGEYWEGPAGNAYVAKRSVEQERVGLVEDLAGQLHDILTDLGNKLSWVYLAVSVLVVACGVRLAAAAAEAATVLGIPDAVGEALIAMVITTLIVTGLREKVIPSINSSARTKLTALLPSGYDVLTPWTGVPNAMTGFSALEGHPQNWQIK